MERKVKFYLLGLLSLGIFATAASIVKTIELKTLTSSDITWDACDLAYWAMTEDYVIIIAACIPTLKPLFSKRPLSPRTFSSSRARAAGSRQVQYALGKTYGSGAGDGTDESVDRILLKDVSVVTVVGGGKDSMV